MSSTAEYDAFGPWIYEIHSAEEIPRLFRSFPLELDSSLLTIKVPRDIERRDANPAMDLYDLLVSLGPEKIVVLTRRGRQYDTLELGYRDIQGITESVDLLDGRLTLHTDESPVQVRYSASSSEIVSHLVELVREKYVGNPAVSSTTRRRTPSGRPPAVETAVQEYYLHLAAHEDLGRVLAAQARHAVVPVAASVWDRALARTWPTTLQSSVITLGSAELQVIHRGRPIATGYKPVHALARTVLPLERLQSVEVRPSPTHDGVAALLVRVGRVAHEFLLDTANAEAVAAEMRRQVRA